ncbi:LPS export ABC transporter permease LptG [Thorsellia anophelis]|uniref:Lipopolysaccharide export system permease protein n=1 Tax=Thorsellia anophelis DSM 18579 TaxID=1123402 RepID=A0A1H9YPK5_9GAMM|nr:LPS export ABC transporter permease LptG [Thorsellia anophelis]SES70412.1 lipopolysaccharide export system permease protein [Thorsellia anophelis DSM 18579]
MFGVLDRYIGRTILSSILMTLFTLIALDGVIKFVEQLRRVGQADYDAMSAMFVTLALLPRDLEIFFPMAALLGALLGLGSLATRSELVVMQAAGFSKLQVASAVMKTAIILMIMNMAIGEWIAPRSEQFARNYRAEKLYGGDLLSTQGSIWARDNNAFIYIERVESPQKLKGVHIFNFNNENQLHELQFAQTAQYSLEKNGWILNEIDGSNLSNPLQIDHSSTKNKLWQTTLTPDKLGVVALSSEALSLTELFNYIRYLKDAGQESRIYELTFWQKVFSPLSVMVMMLMALSFVFGPLRSVPMGVRIITGIAFGFLFYVTNELFGRISIVFALPAILSALLPSILFLLFSIYMLLKKK